MSRWKRGEATVAKLLTDRHLQRIAGEMTDGQAWLDKAGRTLSTADRIVDSDPESALVLAYDAGRQVGTGLLAQQGLRPTTTGGHVAVTRAVIDQFDGRFTGLDTLRRRRNELQYPSYPGDLVESQEAAAAIATVRSLLADASKLLPAIGFFTQ
ncbi:MAG: hypothetical protein ABJD68_08900 [Nakamurella sp.]